jgi:uncharacterized membrane protein YkvA (DUF1232 family)
VRTNIGGVSMSVLKRLIIAFKFLLDKKVPLKSKLWILVPLIYLISPIDLIPDPVLGFGIVDDLVLISFLIHKISEKLNEYIVKRNRNKDIKGKIIEGVEYEVKKDDK